MLSIQFVLPLMGSIYDTKKVEAAGGAAAFAALQTQVDAGVATAVQELNRVQAYAAQISFRDVAIFPAVLLLVFGVIWLRDRSAGGFKGEKIS
jgi:hypothetical protein